MSCYIRTGYVHLINPPTRTLTLSERKFDSVSGIGGYLEGVVGNVLDNHNRRPGKFKPNSTLKDEFEKYRLGEMDLEELSHKIAKTVYEARVDENIEEPTILFVLESSENIYVLETKRDSAFIIKPEMKNGKDSNTVYAMDLAVPAIRANQVHFFSVKLKDLSVTTLEQMHNAEKENYYLYADIILRAEMDKSLNHYVTDARNCFRNTVVDKQKKEHEICNDKETVALLNRFENEMKQQLSIHNEINFRVIAKTIFTQDLIKRKKLIGLLEEYNITEPITSLSRKMIKLNLIDFESKKIRLKNGLTILVPDDIDQKELNINLIAIDGKFEEVTDTAKAKTKIKKRED